jgi:hypothetical protein
MSISLSTLLALAPVPPDDVDPSTGKGPEWGKAAPIGLLVILLLCIAVFFLLRSMTRRINRVPGEFAARESAAAAPDPDRPIPPSDPSSIGGEPVGATDQEPGPPGLVNERSG